MLIVDLFLIVFYLQLSSSPSSSNAFYLESVFGLHYFLNDFTYFLFKITFISNMRDKIKFKLFLRSSKTFKKKKKMEDPPPPLL